MINKAPGGMIPFSTSSYFNNVEHYNLGTWPIVLVGFLASVGITYFLTAQLIRRDDDKALASSLAPAGASSFFKSPDKLIALFLTLSWLWMGAAYHMGFAARLNWGSWVFGAFFILQGLLFAWTGLIRGCLHFKIDKNTVGWIAVLSCFYAVLGHQILAAILDHIFPAAAIVGTSPAPTTIMTLALLMITARPHIHLTIVPLLWALIGSWAADNLAIYEDVPMVLVAVMCLGVVIARKIWPQP